MALQRILSVFQRANPSTGSGERPPRTSADVLSLAAICDKTKRRLFGEALAAADVWLERAGENGDTAFARAYVLFEWGRRWEALDWTVRARRAGNESTEVLRQLGWCYLYANDVRLAEQCMREALAREQDDPTSLFALGAVLEASGRGSDGAAYLERGLALRRDVSALNLLGGVRLAANRFDEAEVLVRDAISMSPDNADSWNNLGIALSRQQRAEQAIVAFERAMACSPKGAHSEVFVNLAIELRVAERREEAIALYRRHLPESASSAGFFNYSLARLSDNALREGWHYNEFRWMRPPMVSLRPDYRTPLWSAQDVRGKVVLLRSEQGVGDVIQFLRYARLVDALGARVLLRPLPGIEDLMRSVPGIHKVLAPDEEEPFDFYIHAMSLPRVFGTDIASVPGGVPYVFADPMLATRWSAAVTGSGIRVGLVWAGSPEHQMDRYRSVTLAALAPVVAVGGVTFYSLQMGKAALELTASALPIVDLAPSIANFSDTAAILSLLDLVICVDTSVAHLAGAMGRPVWMLNALPGDWRWSDESDGSVWYPTMRIFRQQVRGDWAPVVKAVARALEDQVGSVGAGPPARETTTECSPLPGLVRPLDPDEQVSGFELMGAVVETRFGVAQLGCANRVRDRAIRWYGEYLSEHLRRIGTMVPLGGTVLEAGAREGLHAMALANKLGDAGHLFAFEEGPTLRAILHTNVAANKLRNVTVMNDPFDLDALRLTHLDFVKLTGSTAFDALMGSGVQTLWKLRPALLVAELGRATIESSASSLRDAGYRCWHWRTSVFEADNFNRRDTDVLGGAVVDAIIALPEENPSTIDHSSMVLIES